MWTLIAYILSWFFNSIGVGKKCSERGTQICLWSLLTNLTKKLAMDSSTTVNHDHL